MGSGSGFEGLWARGSGSGSGWGSGFWLGVRARGSGLGARGSGDPWGAPATARAVIRTPPAVACQAAPAREAAASALSTIESGLDTRAVAHALVRAADECGARHSTEAAAATAHTLPALAIAAAKRVAAALLARGRHSVELRLGRLAQEQHGQHGEQREATRMCAPRKNLSQKWVAESAVTPYTPPSLLVRATTGTVRGGGARNAARLPATAFETTFGDGCSSTCPSIATTVGRRTIHAAP